MQKEKTTLRRQMIQRRKQLSTTVRQDASRAITKALLALDVYRQAKTILCYAALPEEVDTWEIIKRAWQEEKILGLPRVQGGGEMDFYQVTGREHITGEKGHIPEPIPGLPLLRQADLIIVPGLAFDGRGHRLGYGGGYYDRYLAKHGEAIAIGLAFEEQIVPRVPVEEWDIPLSKILTERRALR